MLAGTLVALRAREPADVPVLHRDLYNDVPTRSSADTRGFRREGTLRASAWVIGAFRDEAIFGVLVDEWRADPAPA